MTEFLHKKPLASFPCHTNTIQTTTLHNNGKNPITVKLTLSEGTTVLGEIVVLIAPYEMEVVTYPVQVNSLVVIANDTTDREKGVALILRAPLALIRISLIENSFQIY